MSVPEPLRHKGRLEVHVKAQYLASYTIKILGNNKTFPADVDYVLTDRIKACAPLKRMDKFFNTLMEV